MPMLICDACGSRWSDRFTREGEPCPACTQGTLSYTDLRASAFDAARTVGAKASTRTASLDADAPARRIPVALFDGDLNPIGQTTVPAIGKFRTPKLVIGIVPKKSNTTRTT